MKNWKNGKMKNFFFLWKNEKMKKNEKIKKNDEKRKKHEKNGFSRKTSTISRLYRCCCNFFRQNPRRFPGFVSECVSFPRKINNPFCGLTVFPKKSDKFSLDVKQKYTLFQRKSTKKSARSALLSIITSPEKYNQITTTTTDNRQQQLTTTTDNTTPQHTTTQHNTTQHNTLTTTTTTTTTTTHHGSLVWRTGGAQWPVSSLPLWGSWLGKLGVSQSPVQSDTGPNYYMSRAAGSYVSNAVSTRPPTGSTSARRRCSQVKFWLWGGGTGWELF